MDSRPLIQVETTAAFPVASEGPTSASNAGAPADAPSEGAPQPPRWIEDARTTLEAPGRYLAYEDSGRRVVVPVSGDLTRIGRSLSAQLRFDDATVSRRHAVIAAGSEGVRVLDDRSLNGVYVNGSRVDAGTLCDGDVIRIGRHSIWFLDNTRVGGALPSEPAVA